MKPRRPAVYAAVLLLAGSLAATRAAAQAAAPDEGDAPRITVEECKQALAKKAAIVVDVRGEDAYRAGHIAGAVLVAGGADVKAKAEELKKAGKTVVTYCA